MSIKTLLCYSPNFDPHKRPKNKVRFLIFHYTGMKNEKSSIKRLTQIQSEVSSHYLIKKNGQILVLVPDLYIAWHAGKSSWKNFNLLNEYSIGIEIVNPGHDFGYKKFTKKQTSSLINLSKFLIKKFRINKRNILGHSDISPDRKKDPGEKFPWRHLSKKNVGIWHNLDKKNLINLRNEKCNSKMKLEFLRNLYKIGYSKKSRNNIEKNKYLIFIIKAFQRHFRPELINGKIDQECLLISKNLK